MMSLPGFYTSSCAAVFSRGPKTPISSLFPWRQAIAFSPNTFSKPFRPRFRPQPEDRNKILIMYGPAFWPWTVLWWAKAAEILKSALPHAPLRWIDGVPRPEEQGKRGGFTGIVVNNHPLVHRVCDGEAFVNKARGAWEKGG